MGFIEKLINITGVKKSSKKDFLEEEASINVSGEMYWMQLAIYTAVSIVANAFTKAEIKVYKKGKQVKNEDYYSLNVKANPNQSASQFWQKVVTKALTCDKGALVIIVKGCLYCADEFNIREKRPFKGNLYDGIVIDDFQLDAVYNSHEVMLFKLDNSAAMSLIGQVNQSYSKIIADSLQAYTDSNIKRYKLKIDGIQAGDEEFNEEFKRYLEKPLRDYVDGKKKIYVEYTGRTLEQMKNEGSSANKSVEDFTKSVESFFKLVGKVFKIPESLMLGNITNVKDIVNQTLTFAVDPFAEMVTDVLTGAYGFGEFSQGNFYRVDTTSVNHIDLIDMAANVSQLVGSSVASINETREAVGLDEINADWARKHYQTKNFSPVENNTQMGGEDNGNDIGTN
jgi:HK97 family phage portal protein